MKIVGMNLNHDGALAFVKNQTLVALVEAQKDNHIRYADLRALAPERVEFGFQQLGGAADAVATSGWSREGRGYFGVDESLVRTTPLDETLRLSTTHERAHIWCAYALSPFDNRQECYALVYEGLIGSFYYIDKSPTIKFLGSPLTEPGHRYALLFELADSSYPGGAQGLSFGIAGKLMALAGVPRSEWIMTPKEQELVELLLEDFRDPYSHSGVIRKERLSHLPFWNAGHESCAFRRFAQAYSEVLFDRFYQFAKRKCKPKLPLLVAGGCGLNCTWNTRWRDSGLFDDVFVPPCPDDSGVAIGAAADVQRHLTGTAKLSWTVYSGEPFFENVTVPQSFAGSPLDYDRVAQLLCESRVIAWIQGRYEIGPRALGNRSLIAAPFERSMRDRLNRIKDRECYRPIAPVCTQEDTPQWFDGNARTPFMLYVHKLRADQLKAITHDDGTARLQTVSRQENAPFHSLLSAFKARTGVGVLCNTSLNSRNRGFINRTSDLVDFVCEKEIDAFVINNRLYERKASET
jgi:hydroxymethyl cephem carbamoyltransferase